MSFLGSLIKAEANKTAKGPAVKSDPSKGGPAKGGPSKGGPAKGGPSKGGPAKYMSHSTSVIFTKGQYKGLKGIVIGMTPPRFLLTMKTFKMIKIEPFTEILPVGSTLTGPGSVSIVHKIILPEKQIEAIKVVSYRDRQTDLLRLGLIIDKELFHSLLFRKYTIADIENPNNFYLLDIFPLDAGTRSEFQSGGIDSLVDRMKNLKISSNLMQAFIQVFKTNALLRDRVHLLPKMAMMVQLSKFDATVLMSNEFGTLYRQFVTVNVYKRDLFNVYYVDEKSLTVFDYDPNKGYYYTYREKQLTMKENQVVIQKQNNAYARIKEGRYANRICEISQYFPKEVKIRLLDTETEVDKHIVNQKHVPIYVSDIFYSDIVLKNSNEAEVVKTNTDGTVTIKEMVNSGSGIAAIEKKVIPMSRIQALNENFTFGETGTGTEAENFGFDPDEPDFNSKVLIADTEPFGDKAFGFEFGNHSDADSDSYSDSGGFDPEDFDPEGFGTEAESFDPNPEDSGGFNDDLVATFKDTERTSTTRPPVKLTKTQKEIKAIIPKILKPLHVIVSDEMALEVALEVSEIVSAFEAKLDAIQYALDFAKTSDFKIVIVYTLIRKRIVRHDQITSNEKVADYIFKKKFDSIFLTPGWSSLTDLDIQEAKNIVSQGNKLTIFKTFVDLCSKIVSQVVSLDPPVHDFHDFSREFQPRENAGFWDKKVKVAFQGNTSKSRKSVYINDLVTGKVNNLPQNGYIIWGVYKPILERYIEAFKEKAANTMDDKAKDGYLYIQENIFRLPFAIRDDTDKVDSAIYPYLKVIYENILNDIRIKNSIVAEKEAIMQEKLTEKRKNKNDFEEYLESIKKRTGRDVYNLLGDGDIDNTPAYERKRLMLEYKNSIDETTRRLHRQ